MQVTKGARLGRYEIVSPLGKGGMGEVYLARDTHLDRPVALKILPAEYATDRDRLQRFVREAKSASALNHPNIISVYDIGDLEGTHFIAYEFVDGVTLRALATGAALPLASALDIATQVVSALVEAHHAGIVHRDIKPDNVMVRTSGLVKLLDFGIARLAAPAVAADGDATMMQERTQPGLLIGTPQFMSPEQARGAEVTHQTDLFSFGVLLYELLSGASPFAGNTVSDVLAAVLTREPTRLTTVPAALADVVAKALEKDLARRYQTAGDLLRDLTSVRQALDGAAAAAIPAAGTATVAVERTGEAATGAAPRSGVDYVTSVAVLPFADMSAGKDNEFFCDGLAEELLNALAKLDSLKVAARTSAFSFKGKQADIATIARTLGVSKILDGSVRRSGNRLRISVQLVNAADGYQMWSERYDREMRDIFDLQDDITLAVVEALKVTLFGDDKAAVLKRYTDNAEAYELFLKGRYHSYKYTAQGWQRAVAFFEQAIALEPEYALAHAALAAARGCQWFFGLLPADTTIPASKAGSRQALALDADLADAHLSLAMITFFYDWDWSAAEHAFQRSIALNPNDAEALSYYALFLAFVGRVDDAVRLTRKAVALDPLAPLINMNGGWTYFSVGLTSDAVAQAGKMLDSDPDFYGAYWLRGAIHLSEGTFGSAADDFATAVSLGGHQIVVADQASAYALAGRTSEADHILARLLETRRAQYVPAICLARVYCRLGQMERAVEWLETAFAERNGEMVFLQGEISGAADGDPLRQLASEPRVAALLDRMHLP